MDTPKTVGATAKKKYQKASTVCCSANVLLFLAYQCAFFGGIFFSENLARIFSSGSKNLQKIPGNFLALFELSRLPLSLSLSHTHTHTHTLFLYLNLTLFYQLICLPYGYGS
jgi:hypothetical protein